MHKAQRWPWQQLSDQPWLDGRINSLLLLPCHPQAVKHQPLPALPHCWKRPSAPWNKPKCNMIRHKPLWRWSGIWRLIWIASRVQVGWTLLPEKKNGFKRGVQTISVHQLLKIRKSFLTLNIRYILTILRLMKQHCTMRSVLEKYRIQGGKRPHTRWMAGHENLSTVL